MIDKERKHEMQIPLFEEELSEISGSYHIVKENTIIRASYDLTLYEHRVLAIVASLMKPTDIAGQHYFFRVTDFAKYYRLNSKDIYSTLKDALINLRSRTFVIQRPKEAKRITGWINWAEIIPSTGFVEVEIDDRIRPYFLGIRKSLGYTKYPLENVRDFKSPYSYRFYDYFKAELQDNNSVEVVMTIEDIKIWLALKNQYKQYSDLKKRVILPALEDINGKEQSSKKVNRKKFIAKSSSDILVAWEENRPGRKVVGITFTVTRRNKLKQEDKIQKEDLYNTEEFTDVTPIGNPIVYQELTTEQRNVVTEFLSAGVHQITIDQAINTYGPQSLIYMLQYYKKKKPKDPSGYAASILKNGWGIPSNEYEKEVIHEQEVKENQKRVAEEIENSLKETVATQSAQMDAIITEYINTLDKEQLKHLAGECKKYLKKIDHQMEPFFKVDMSNHTSVGLFRSYIEDIILKQNIDKL